MMKSQRKLPNKLSIFIMLMTLIWLLTDFSSRFSSSSSSNDITSTQVDIKPLMLPQLTNNFIAELNLRYEPYKAEDEIDTLIEPGMSEAEKAKQQGKLQAFYIDKYKLELKAVIKSASNKSKGAQQTNSKVLLLVTELATGMKKIEEYNNDGRVYGYDLRIIKNTQVSLSKSLEQGEQNIVLTMYEQ